MTTPSGDGSTPGTFRSFRRGAARAAPPVLRPCRWPGGCPLPAGWVRAGRVPDPVLATYCARHRRAWYLARRRARRAERRADP